LDTLEYSSIVLKVHFTDKVMHVLYVSVNKCYKLHLTQTKTKTDSNIQSQRCHGVMVKFESF